MSASPAENAFLILSGAYSTSDIVAEYGRLPPAFLPIGLAPLYKLQLRLASSMGDKVYLSIPCDYHLSVHDELAISETGCVLLRVDPNASLVNSCKSCLDLIEHDGAISILFGDTYIEALESAEDAVAVAAAHDYYRWSGLSDTLSVRARFHEAIGDERILENVVCGFFSFSSTPILRKALNGANSFPAALNTYSEIRALQTVKVKKWYDLGHISRLARSRRDLLVTRSFNSIEVNGNRLTKRSEDVFKINCEFFWYKNLPPSLRMFTPHLLCEGANEEAGIASYAVEYLHFPTLSELYLFGRLPDYNWRHILALSLCFLEKAKSAFSCSSLAHQTHEDTSAIFNKLYREKTFSRVKEFLELRNWSGNTEFSFDGMKTPHLLKVADELLSKVRPTAPSDLTIMHGDFFFSNMLYDFRADQIKVVDPRGYWRSGEPSMLGDWRYDLAKLAHSLYGRYDEIVSGRQLYTVNGDFEYQTSKWFKSTAPLVDEFASMALFNAPTLTNEIKAIVALLFLSMLPLHKDNAARQTQLLANALRIYVDVRRSET